MSTKRQDILDKIKELLNYNYHGLKTIQINRSTVVDRDSLAFPAAFIYSGPFSRADGAIGQDEWVWEIIVEVFWSDTDVELVMDSLYTALADNTLAGKCDWFILKSGQEFTSDAEGSSKVLQFVYECRYHHVFGTP